MIANAQHRILWLPGEERSWDDEYSSRSAAGIRIDASNALQVGAVFSCLRVLAETIASLPLHVLERQVRGTRRASELPLYKRLHQQPNDWQTSFEWREQAVFHIGLWGDAYSEIRGGRAGAVDSLVPLHPSRMKVERVENGRLRYLYREENGRETAYSQDAILHMRGPSDDGVHGMSIVESCKDAIALARACEIHGARYFGNGARPGFVLSTDNELSAEAREQLRQSWERMHGGVGNSNRTAVLVGGLRPLEIPQSSMHDAQFIEARKWQLAEIARLFRVPLHLLGAETSPGSVEHAGLDFVQHTILPWLRRFESAFVRDLISDDDRYFVEFDVRGLMRGDAASRSAYYRAMWDIGALSTNDILELENRNPVEGGDERYRPLNMGVLGAPPSVDDVLAQQQEGSGIDGQAVEGGVAAAEGEPVVEEIVVEESPQIADVSLNGAQTSGILEILTKMNEGLINAVAAKALIMAAFPSFPQSNVDAIIAGTSTNPLQSEPEAAPPPAQPAESLAGEPPGESRAAPGTIVEGQWVTFDDGVVGKVDHVMTEGTLNLGDVEVPASPDAPVMLVSVWLNGDFNGQVPVAMADAELVEEPEDARGWKPKRKPGKRNCGTGADGFGPGNTCGKGGDGGGADSGGSGDSDSGSDIGATRERQAKEREAWKSEKNEATKELNKQEKQDTAKLDRQYERELSGKIQAAGKEHDKETSAKVREVDKEYAPQIEAAGSDVKQVLSVMNAQNQATDAVRAEQDKAWRAKSEAIRKDHDAAFGEKYDKLRQDYDAKHLEMQDRFDAKREEIQAKHDAEREQVLKKKRG